MKEKKSFRGHFDGQKVCIDEPVHLEKDANLLITLLTEEQPASDEKELHDLGTQGLRYAYGSSEPEYLIQLIREPNPSYNP